jgi:hypothetical protein
MLGYRRGDIVEIDYDKMPEPLKAVLRLGKHMTLIDPLELPDAGGESSNNTEEYRPFGVTDNGQTDSSSGGKRKVRTSEDSE